MKDKDGEKKGRSLPQDPFQRYGQPIEQTDHEDPKRAKVIDQILKGLDAAKRDVTKKIR